MGLQESDRIGTSEAKGRELETLAFKLMGVEL